MACSDVGLGKYVADDENIENDDVVVWYTIIFSHSPHTEDIPFVTTESFSVRLDPHNFFEVNPSTTLGSDVVNRPILIGANCPPPG